MGAQDVWLLCISVYSGAFGTAQRLCEMKGPDEDSTQRCQALFSSIQGVASLALPPGWRVVAYGSYIQATCLPGAALDLALVSDGPQSASIPGQEALAKVMSVLTRATTAFKQLPATRSNTVRLAAGDFAQGRCVAKQEVTLCIGSARIGKVDELLRRVLEIDARAMGFVLLVKRWAIDHGYSAQAGCFPWTVLAVFHLQSLGFLPPLHCIVQDIFLRACGLGGSTDLPHLSLAGKHPLVLFATFLETWLGYMALPDSVRPVISLWTGRFLPGPEAASMEADLSSVVAGIELLRAGPVAASSLRAFAAAAPPQPDALAALVSAFQPNLIAEAPPASQPDIGSSVPNVASSLHAFAAGAPVHVQTETATNTACGARGRGRLANDDRTANDVAAPLPAVPPFPASTARGSVRRIVARVAQRTDAAAGLLASIVEESEGCSSSEASEVS